VAAHIGAASDPEARWSRKRHTEWTGYKVHLSETCDEGTPNLIVAVHTTVSHDRGRRRPGRGPLTFSTRRGSGSGNIMSTRGTPPPKQWTKADQNGMELIGPLALDRSWQAKEGLGYDRSSFQIDWDTGRPGARKAKTSYSWTAR